MAHALHVRKFREIDQILSYLRGISYDSPGAGHYVSLEEGTQTWAITFGVNKGHRTLVLDTQPRLTTREWTVCAGTVQLGKEFVRAFNPLPEFFTTVKWSFVRFDTPVSAQDGGHYVGFVVDQNEWSIVPNPYVSP